MPYLKNVYYMFENGSSNCLNSVSICLRAEQLSTLVTLCDVVECGTWCEYQRVRLWISDSDHLKTLIILRCLLPVSFPCPPRADFVALCSELTMSLAGMQMSWRLSARCWFSTRLFSYWVEIFLQVLQILQNVPRFRRDRARHWCVSSLNHQVLYLTLHQFLVHFSAPTTRHLVSGYSGKNRCVPGLDCM